MKTSPIKGQGGFSLIELMVVLALSGFLLAAIYGLYNSHMKSAYTQEEVVEVQQNLRVAMDSIVRDIEMAGFLVPAGSNPVQAATNGLTTDAVTLNTASAIGIYGRITTQITASPSTALTLESTDAVAQFSSGHNVRIIRPQDSSQPLGDINSICTVTGASGTTLTLSMPITGVTLVPGDMVARTIAGGANPNTVAYSVVNGGSCPSGQQCIARNANAVGNDIVANNISNLQFSYILTDNREVDTPNAATTPSEYTLVRAVRVTISGETEKLVARNEITEIAKPRTMTTVVSIRNK